jgi:hypothetical protein
VHAINLRNKKIVLEVERKKKETTFNIIRDSSVSLKETVQKDKKKKLIKNC